MLKPELLAPAGSMEKLKAAVLYGADAVYLGGTNYGLRQGAGNFTPDQMALAVEFAHRRNVRVYVTVNIYARNHDLTGLPPYLKSLDDLGVDGLIAADPGVVRIAAATVPHIPLHLSTQANTTNYAAVEFWAELGVSRVVLARELSLEEIREIRQKTGVQIEMFVHGAMCISYSGRCLLSSYMTGREANRGDCSHPCRWRYSLVEEKRPGQYFPVQEDSRGTYIISSRDLCLLPRLPDLVRAGVDSFKIEGRVKSVHYVATVVKVYREAIDACMIDPEGFHPSAGWLDELAKVSNRDYTMGFIDGAGLEGHGSVEGIYRRDCTFVGLVKDWDAVGRTALVEQRNRFAVGDCLEVVSPSGPPMPFTVEKILDQDGLAMEAAPHPCQIVSVPLPFPVEEFCMLRRCTRQIP